MKLAVFCSLLLVTFMAHSQIAVDQEPLVFETSQQEARFNQLTEELRCLVCQNQNLADSDAPLAHDLRDEIFAMMQTGKSNDEIKQYLIERYGDFVLYRPPLQANTLFLWLTPGILLLGGGIAVAVSIRKRRNLTGNIPGGGLD